jgi:hypothetical protein
MVDHVAHGIATATANANHFNLSSLRYVFDEFEHIAP